MGMNSIGVRDTVSGSSTNGKLPINVNKLAVFAIKKDFGDHIEAYFLESLFKKGYEVASRADLPIVSQEIAFQQSGNTAGTAAELGRILKTDAVLLVDITEYIADRNQPMRLSMSARLVAVESSKIIWINSKSYNPSLLEMVVKIPIAILAVGNNELDSLSNSILADFPDK